MGNTKELNEILYGKMSAEYEQFISRLYQMEPDKIIHINGNISAISNLI